ncbi:hypothetical protein NEOC95_001950 [Neochlamydia sp. AcF95]|nr:hypothetical protein [Neochlamydia sp. AcF95]
MFNQAAYQRECRTLARHYLKGSEKESQAFLKNYMIAYGSAAHPIANK